MRATASGSVKKGASWALRNLGKRDPKMHEIAVAAAHELRASERRSARWVGADALRELEGEKVRARLGLPA